MPHTSSFIAMILSIILLIYKPQEKAVYNNTLKLCFHALLSKVENADIKNITTFDDYSNLKNEYDEIAKNEEERYVIVEAVCSNNVLNARNCDKSYLVNIPKCYRYLMHFWPFYSFDPMNQ